MTRARPFETEQLAAASAIRFERRQPVRFQDVDAAGTVFFPRVLDYFSDAYLGMLQAGGVDVPLALADGVWYAPLVHAEADYLKPMRFGTELLVQVVATKLGRSSASIGYRALDAKDRTAMAVGQTVHVFVDGKSFRPTEMPTEVRAALSRPPR